MANIQDCPGFEPFGEDVKAARKKRLLVVEDDRLLSNTLCYNLSAAGYTVDAAMTKSAAVNFCEAQDYDLIVLDVNLPDGNGFDFCKEIKERRPDRIAQKPIILNH